MLIDAYCGNFCSLLASNFEKTMYFPGINFAFSEQSSLYWLKTPFTNSYTLFYVTLAIINVVLARED